MSAYRLSCEVAGHELDVRGVAIAFYPEGAIVTASRDRTARLWTKKEDGEVGFNESHCMTGHNNFISCVCVLPPSGDDPANPHGLILTGSNDNNINAYSLDSPLPVYTLSGHADTVCSLATGKFGTVLSGSWDTTAKVWLKTKLMLTLKGHEAAVWAVAILPEQGVMLTGSADKTIKMWKAGNCERTFVGHTDCVRGVAILTSTEFLSASNDASVRRWLVTGECVQEYYGHTNYIYSLSVLPNGTDFVTTGEDRTLRVWREGVCSQTITLPAQSVWCSAVLPNGDLVVGSSDAMVRVFTANESRMASAQVLDLFDKQVASASIHAKAENLEQIKADQLPGPDFLKKPGTKEGQSVMIRNQGMVEAYSWSMADGRWNKVGEVVGSSGQTAQPSSSGKTMYQGKEYDYVFSVDIEEGKPPLKLPFNVNEDPWFAAQRFLEQNDLSPLFLDQVANFILENTKGVTLGAAPSQASSDPFTGGARYIPGGGGNQPRQQPQQQPAGSYTDPLTGGSRHIPSYAAPASESNGDAGDISPVIPQNPYFPKNGYVTFDSGNSKAILGKLGELNAEVEEEKRLDELSLEKVGQLLDLTATASPTAQQLETLTKILAWSEDKVFPGLDILRLAVRHPEVNVHFCNHQDGPQFLALLMGLLSGPDPGQPPAPANQMLVFRTLSNAFNHPPGRALLLWHWQPVLGALEGAAALPSKNARVAAATLLLNYAVALRGSEDVEAKANCLRAAAPWLPAETDNEARFRLLVALGTLAQDDDNSAAVAKSLELGEAAGSLVGVCDPAKVGDTAKHLALLLN